MKKSELRQIIKEEVESLFKNNGRLTPYLSMEQFDDKWKTDFFKKPINETGNQLPPKNSNWYKFADEFDMGIYDLDDLANQLGFEDFRDMDISITPKSLYGIDRKEFTKALQQSSVRASSLYPGDIQKKITNL